jgi:hypothetical protein
LSLILAATLPFCSTGDQIIYPIWPAGNSIYEGGNLICKLMFSALGKLVAARLPH